MKLLRIIPSIKLLHFTGIYFDRLPDFKNFQEKNVARIEIIQETEIKIEEHDLCKQGKIK